MGFLNRARTGPSSLITAEPVRSVPAPIATASVLPATPASDTHAAHAQLAIPDTAAHYQSPAATPPPRRLIKTTTLSASLFPQLFIFMGADSAETTGPQSQGACNTPFLVVNIKEDALHAPSLGVIIVRE